MSLLMYRSHPFMFQDRLMSRSAPIVVGKSKKNTETSEEVG